MGARDKLLAYWLSTGYHRDGLFKSQTFDHMMATETEPLTETPEPEVTETVTQTQPDAVDKLVKLCGFVAGSDKYVTKEALETALLGVTEELLDELVSLHGYSVKDRVERGINNSKDLLCLLRRVLRKRNRFIFYERFKEKGKTKYKYFLK